MADLFTCMLLRQLIDSLSRTALWGCWIFKTENGSVKNKDWKKQGWKMQGLLH